MTTLPLFAAADYAPEKPVTVTITAAGERRHVHARTLFEHLRRALEGRDLSGTSVLTIWGDGSVTLDDEVIYRPRRRGERAG